jgi:alpha-glucosidase
MRPVFLDYPEAPASYGDDRDFLFGGDLFVAPAFSEMPQSEDARLPPGGWYEFGTSVLHDGGSTVSLRPALGELPVFARAGAIIPMQPVVQDTDEKPKGPLELHVYPGANCRGSLYEDDGHSFAYQRGKFLRADYACELSAGDVVVTGRLEHDEFRPWWSSLKLVVYGFKAAPHEIRSGGKAVRGWTFEEQSGAVTVLVPRARGDWRLVIVD